MDKRDNPTIRYLQEIHFRVEGPNKLQVFRQKMLSHGKESRYSRCSSNNIIPQNRHEEQNCPERPRRAEHHGQIRFNPLRRYRVINKCTPNNRAPNILCFSRLISSFFAPISIADLNFSQNIELKILFPLLTHYLPLIQLMQPFSLKLRSLPLYLSFLQQTVGWSLITHYELRDDHTCITSACSLLLSKQ